MKMKNNLFCGFLLQIKIMENKQLTVCVGPRIATPPLLHSICGGGLAPAELHEICVLIPATRG